MIANAARREMRRIRFEVRTHPAAPGIVELEDLFMPI